MRLVGDSELCVMCNRSSEEYNVLKISLEGQIEELERTFEAAHQAYLQNTGARATAFQTLTTNDAAAARVIEQRMKKLVQMQVTLRNPPPPPPRLRAHHSPPMFNFPFPVPQTFQELLTYSVSRDRNISIDVKGAA